MNKKTLPIATGLFAIIIVCLSAGFRGNRGYFEGKITYRNEYIIKNKKVDSVTLAKAFGKTATLLFKNGNYLERYDDGSMMEQLYNRHDNKVYIKQDESDTLYWFDCGIQGQKMLKFEIIPHEEKILGIDCDELVTYYKNKTVSFYFNPDTLNINPEWYKEFTAYNKHFNTGKMKSLYLKYKIEYPEFTVTVTATSITNQVISDSLFSVPKSKILIERQ